MCNSLLLDLIGLEVSQIIPMSLMSGGKALRIILTKH